MTRHRVSKIFGAWLAGVVLGIVILPPAIQAQTSLATLQVKVTDTQGQFVPGAV
jgi:hypothetical protein